MSKKQKKEKKNESFCDNHSDVVLAFYETEEYKKNKEKYTKIALLRKEEYKEKGKELVKSDLINKWNSELNNMYKTEESIWYNGVILDATLEIMEKLSNGESIEEVYKVIDIQNEDAPCIKLGMKLTGWQNYTITCLVGTYHIRGQEFCDYRNAFVKRPHYKQKDSKKLALTT